MGIGVNNFDPEAPMTGKVIRGNVVSKAGIAGIAVATAADAAGTVTDALAEDNIAIGATEDGIDVDSSATTLTGNARRLATGTSPPEPSPASPTEAATGPRQRQPRAVPD